jgi:flagellar motility protein MotE (MotC chaperone)
MNAKTIRTLLMVKGALLVFAAVGVARYAQTSVAATEAEVPKASAAEVKKDAGSTVPEVPKGELNEARTIEVRKQLELLRQDAIVKIESLTQARKSYEKAKLDVEAKLAQVKEERKLLEDTLQKERDAKADRLTESVEFFAKMEPRKSAGMMETMDRDLVILVLRKLQPRLVTRILESMTPKKATEYMEYYTKIRSGREYALMKELGVCQSETNSSTFWDKDESEKKESTVAAAPASPTATPAATPTGTPAQSQATPVATPAVTPALPAPSASPAQ